MVPHEGSNRRRLVWRGAVAALAAGSAMAALRFLLDARTPVDLLFDLTSHLLGVPAMFNALHALPWGVGDSAKYVLFALMAVLYLALWTLAGPAFCRLRPAWRLALPPLASVLLVGSVLLPLSGQGAFGSAATNYFYPPIATHVWAAVGGAVYALVLGVGLPRRRGAAFAPGRRDVLERGGKVVILFAATAGFFRMNLGTLARAMGVEGMLARIEGLSPAVTPTADHYVVSKNFLNPKVNVERWQLKLHGSVDHPLVFDLDRLKALPSTERPSTLTCVSNVVGGDLIGTSLWTGVQLRDVLAMAGVQEGAQTLILRGADNYSDSIPLDVAMREGNLVAYLQNGEPLTRDHGFPVRLLVPSIYGMKNVKWLVDIELSDEPYSGFWQQRGWSNDAVVQTMSRIDTARATDLGGGMAAIGGVAFAGTRGVKAVEVSVDGGTSWQTATVQPAANDLSWNLWGFEWKAQPGAYQVMVRATDDSGTTQTSDRRSPLPAGATGWHKLRVQVG